MPGGHAIRGRRSAEQRAADLLAHYLRFGVEAAGKQWDGDTRAECELIVAYIVDAATAAARDDLQRAPRARNRERL